MSINLDFKRKPGISLIPGSQNIGGLLLKHKQLLFLTA
jgi:hypothetical protein